MYNCALHVDVHLCPPDYRRLQRKRLPHLFGTLRRLSADRGIQHVPRVSYSAGRIQVVPNVVLLIRDGHGCLRDHGDPELLH